MDGQNNTQNTNGNEQQRTPEFTSFFIPFTFNIGQPQQGRGSNEQTPPSENNLHQNGSQNGQLPQFHLFVFPMPVTPNGDGQATPNVMFFTPFFMPQQEVHKPRASESAMKNLPIVTITKEHVGAKGSCSICLDPFSLSTESDGNEDKATGHRPIRKMPCDHMFCEPCLFQWLRQSNTCPLCRKEIEAEEPRHDNGIPNGVPTFGINISTPYIPTTATTTTTTTTTTAANMTQPNSSSSHDSHSARCSNISCALANVGCCEETDNNTMPTPIVTLPQCHHRFHVSCLRTSLLVEGYSLDDINSMSRTLNFRCPTCRAPAIIQSDMLKLDSVPNERISPEGGQGQV